MRLFSTIKAATCCCSYLLVARHFSAAARRGVRPGGEELKRLRLDDLAPTPRLELLFGLSPCLLALRAARRRVARLLLQAGRAGLQGERAELLRVAEARDIPVLRPRRQKLDALCHYQVHQGVCMEVTPLRPRPYTEAGDVSPNDDPQQLWLVLEGLQDPRNLGAVLRTAHFLGVDKIITSRRNSCPLTPVVSKASAGAMEVMDVFCSDDLAGFLQAKARQGWLVAGTVGSVVSQASEIPITSCLEFLWDRPTLLVLGNEGSGLSQEVQAACRLLLSVLPGRQLPPGLESLNVSVAAARGRVSLQRRKEGRFSRTLQQYLKDSEWLHTQDCLWDPKKRGTEGAEVWTCQSGDFYCSAHVLEPAHMRTQVPVCLPGGEDRIVVYCTNQTDEVFLCHSPTMEWKLSCKQWTRNSDLWDGTLK
ncbi:rRNA methyltransferase 1, mitochondrial isoform X1 [Cavia porcellus]|uniref:rRNA methyltransferase 1, mitochondrial isoform X1 n=1 Tax=Cavia porcellus TaxID=10141 RepID=UPI002FE373D3